MRGADVPRLDVRPTAVRCEVLEELDDVLSVRQAEVRHADVRVRVADDRCEVPTLLLLLGDFLAAEQVAVERDRPVEIRHGVAGVVDPVHATAVRNSRPPPSVTTKISSTRAP